MFSEEKDFILYKKTPCHWISSEKKILQTNFRLQSLELEISDMKECLPFNFLQSQSSFEFQKFGEVAENNPRTVELFPNKYLEIIA